MARVTIKYLERFKDRHGNVRLYYRKVSDQGVKRVPLRGPEGSADFWQDYQDASNCIAKVTPGIKRSSPGTMRWLVEQYYKSAKFKIWKTVPSEHAEASWNILRRSTDISNIQLSSQEI